MERELTDRDRLSVCLSARLTLPLLPPRQMSSSASPASRAEPPLTQARSYHYHPHHLVSRLLCFAFAFRRNRDCPSSASVLWSVADESLGKRVTERERSERRLPPRRQRGKQAGAGGRARRLLSSANGGPIQCPFADWRRQTMDVRLENGEIREGTAATLQKGFLK